MLGAFLVIGVAAILVVAEEILTAALLSANGQPEGPVSEVAAAATSVERCTEVPIVRSEASARNLEKSPFI